DFVNWDDQQYLTENSNVQAGLSWSNVVWAFTTTHSPYWHPLTWLSHMLDVTMFGMDAGWHHVTSLVMHIASTLLLFTLLRRMTRETGKSAFVAAIFAVHPLHVESVAWLAERKDVLSTLFLLLTIWMYVRYVERPSVARYLAVVCVYALALMAKPMVVTLPFALLLLDLWPLRRVGRPAFLLLEKLPLLALAIGVSVATVIVQKEVGAVAGLDVLPIGARVENAIVGYVAYVSKTIWPTHLAPFYPLRTYPVWLIALAALVLAVTTAAAVLARRKWPFVTIGWLWYFVTVAPVIGLTQSGEQAMADRFMYVPMIGLLVIAAWGVPSILAGAVPVSTAGTRRATNVIAITSVLASAILAHAQTGYWTDSVTLWRHTVEVTDANYVAYENLGQALRERADLDGAIANYEQALQLLPPNSPGHESVIRDSLGLIIERKGRPEEAESYFADAVRLSPRFAEAQTNLGNALAAQGKFDEAIVHYRAALVLKPALTEALVGVGGALVREGRP
ncbi:MAG TPA: tetratricopeptide repeat protein, partial [Gemmatimonadaceae bacterium]|nr:tetratricopeptide repeat protein [Gemmatimonadaceae bacterium]